MSGPTKEQTLHALDRVSRGEVWEAKPQNDPWKHIGAVAAQLVPQPSEAAE